MNDAFMDQVLSFIRANRQRFLDELFTLLRIPSVSTKSEHQEDMQRCAQLLVEEFQNIGMPVVELHQTPGHPIVYGEWLQAPGKPTVLIYGHYDVQPPEPLEEWHSPPFEPTIKNDELFCRGSADNKGQLFIHVKAAEAFLKQRGRLPINVKFLIEGEEEVGGEHLEQFIVENKQKLQCDAALVSDSHMFAKNLPTLVSSLRGIVYLQVDVQGPRQDLHSGCFGGAVQNPANALATVIAKLKDDSGRVLIPGFYDNVRELSATEKSMLASLPFDEEEYRKELGVKALFGESGFGVLTHVAARPTLDVNGILSGYTGEGAKTIIPAKATAKISMRLVPHQDPEEIMAATERFIQQQLPPGVAATVRRFHAGKPYMAPLDSVAMQTATKALRQAFAKEVVYLGEGGSIPVVQSFKEQLGVDTVLMGFGVPDENLHSPNEKFNLGHFYKGIEASALFLEGMAQH